MRVREGDEMYYTVQRLVHHPNEHEHEHEQEALKLSINCRECIGYCSSSGRSSSTYLHRRSSQNKKKERAVFFMYELISSN